MGLDNTRPESVRAVCVTTDMCWQWMPSVSAWTQCRSLADFQAFWKAEGLCPDGLAISNAPHDPFGIIGWLEAQGMGVSSHDDRPLYHGLDEAGEPEELAPCYRRAYSLALRAAFQREAPAVAIELSYRLGRFREQMSEMQRILDHLVHELLA